MRSEIPETPEPVNVVLVDYSPDQVKVSVPYASGRRAFFLSPGEAESIAAMLTFAANAARSLEATQLRLLELPASA